MLNPFRELRAKLQWAEGWSRLGSLNQTGYSSPSAIETKTFEESNDSELQPLEPSTGKHRAPGRLRLVLCITTNVVSTVSIVSLTRATKLLR
jgi:solute carrier family 35 protein E3